MSYVEWWDAGFHDVIGVTPPGVEISPRSKLRPQDLGKVPGQRNAEGTWGGYDWLRFETNRRHCARWHKTGANLGLRAEHYPAVDIDVLDRATVKTLCKLAYSTLGWAPRRTGRRPKALLLYRTVEPFTRLRLHLARGEGEALETGLIEILGFGQQFVVEGIHPGTGQPYVWNHDPVEYGPEALTPITVGQADQFLEDAAAALQATGWRVEREGTAKEAGRGAIVSPALPQADLATVRQAMSVLPNDNQVAPARMDYLRVGYALKAALPEHPDEAFALWWDWCQRWEGNERVQGNTLDQAESDWDRMVPPFTIGAPYLFDLARDFGFDDAVNEFADGAIVLEPLPPPKPVDRSGALPYTDAWLAWRILDQHGHRIRYSAGEWLLWDGARWRRDETGTVQAWAGRTLRAAGREALDTLKKKTDAENAAKRCASVAVLRDALKYASISPMVAVSPEVFDADPWALNTPAGILDLQTGLMHPSDPARMMTRCTLVAPDPSIVPHRWLSFVHEAAGGDLELVDYLQRLMGYALTGSTREHCLAFLYGSGGNGKGTFLNTMVKIFGGYAEVAAMDTFVSSRFDRHPTELAALAGARLVTAQETQEGRAWDEAKVKAVTGGDPIKARYMRKDYFTFQPHFKLLFDGNHRPHVANLDDAMRRRFHLVPFTVKPKVVDRGLDLALAQEFAGILAWAVEGCLRWQREGLFAPMKVQLATREYFLDEDPLGRWLNEQTIPAEDSGSETRELFASWRMWCGDRNEKVGTERSFSQALAMRGYERWQHPKTRRHGFAGLAVKDGTFEDAQQDFDIIAPPKRSGKPATMH